MITSIFHGELGNNLFQLAAAVSLAEENGFDMKFSLNRDCYVPINVRPLELPTMFDNDIVYTNELDVSGLSYYQSPDIGPFYGYTPIPVQDNMILKGYFQSEKYFKNIESLLRKKYFVFNSAIIDKLNKAFDIDHIKNSISIHVRIGGDRPRAQLAHKDVSLDYYETAINKIKQQENSDFKLTIFSDNIEWCKANLGYDALYVTGNSAVEDMCLMSMCKHNIIGNSSFSWWAAWLNENKNKIVVVPYTQYVGPSLSHLYLDDLFPEEWIKL